MGQAFALATWCGILNVIDNNCETPVHVSKRKKGRSSSKGKSLFRVNASSSIFIALKRLGGVCCSLCIFLKCKANYFKEWVSLWQENLSDQILPLQGSQRKHRGILELWVWRAALMFSFFLAFCQILLSIFSESSIALFIISFINLMFASSVWFGTEHLQV